MKEMLELLEKAMEKQKDIKEKNRELYLLGFMTGEELIKVNAIHNYAINRINEIHIEVYKECNKED